MESHDISGSNRDSSSEEEYIFPKQSMNNTVEDGKKESLIEMDVIEPISSSEAKIQALEKVKLSLSGEHALGRLEDPSSKNL